MGGLTSTLGGALGGLQTLSTGLGLVSNIAGVRNDRREQEQSLRQLQERQALEAQQQAQQNALQREQITLEAKNNEANRRRALKSAVARQRALYGASGVGNAGNGSQQAVLLGLFDETQEDLDQRARLDDLRNRAIDMGAEQQRSVNVLQLEQLRQRQNLGRLSSNLKRTSDYIDFAKDAGGIFF